jgi:hypothetical protein
MNFALANKAPINVNIEGKDYSLKRFTRGDWVAWAAEIDGARSAEATAGLDPLQRSRMLLIYTVEPVSHADLGRRVQTPEGTGRIIKTCAEKSAVPQDVIDRLLSDGDEEDLATLALMLASIVDPLEKPDRPDAKEEGGEAADPLSSSAVA